MNLRSGTIVRAAGWGVAGLIGVGALTGVATAVSSSPTAPAAPASTPTASGPAAQSGAQPDAAAKRGWGLLGKRLEHGELVVQVRKEFRTVLIQRGTVTAVDSKSVTVKSRDGFTQTWQLAADTKIRKAGKTVAAGAVAVGNAVRVRGPKAGDTVTARVLLVRVPKPAD